MGGGGGLIGKILPIAASALGAYFLGPAVGGMLERAGMAAGTAAAAGTAVGGAVGGLAGFAAAGAVGGNQGINISMPTPSTPTEIPQIGGTESQAAATNTITALRQRQGRAASILSQGGMDNTSIKLGG